MRAKHTDPQREAELAEQYQSLAKNLAAKLFRKCGKWDLDHIESAAQVGLLRAIRSHKPEHGKLTSWIHHCCHSEMLDAIRNADHLSRVNRKKQNARDKAIAYLTQQLQRTPTDEDLEAVGVRTRQSPILGTLEKQHHHPRARASRCTLKEAETFREATRGLSLLEQNMVYLRYYHDATMLNMGIILGLSESRISQIMSDVLKKLRQQSIFDALVDKIAE